MNVAVIAEKKPRIERWCRDPAIDVTKLEALRAFPLRDERLDLSNRHRVPNLDIIKVGSVGRESKRHRNVRDPTPGQVRNSVEQFPAEFVFSQDVCEDFHAIPHETKRNVDQRPNRRTIDKELTVRCDSLH